MIVIWPKEREITKHKKSRQVLHTLSRGITRKDWERRRKKERDVNGYVTSRGGNGIGEGHWYLWICGEKGLFAKYKLLDASLMNSVESFTSSFFSSFFHRLFKVEPRWLYTWPTLTCAGTPTPPNKEGICLCLIYCIQLSSLHFCLSADCSTPLLVINIEFIRT